jgi:hypothetical protein
VTTRAEAAAERRQALQKLIDQAIAGDARPLYDFLARNSGLPGIRTSEGLLTAFAETASARGEAADKMLEAAAALDPDMAQGGTGYEFVPMCALLALAERAARDDKAVPRALDAFHRGAEDLRFRVRDLVPRCIARVGEVHGTKVIDELGRFTDGFFHAAAVLKSFSFQGWLSAIDDGAKVIARLDEAFALVKDAPRSAARYPGHKELIAALGTAPAIVAARFGVPVFDMLAAWSRVKDPVLREVVAQNLGGSKLTGRHAQELERVRRVLDETAPPRRDPNTDFGPTRGRGQKRRR